MIKIPCNQIKSGKFSTTNLKKFSLNLQKYAYDKSINGGTNRTKAHQDVALVIFLNFK